MRRKAGNQGGVLTQIIDNRAAGNRVGLNGLQCLCDNDWRSRVGLAAQSSAGPICDQRCRPTGCIEPSLIPARWQESGVIGFATINLGVGYGAGRSEPLAIGGDDLAGAVGIVEI